MNDATRFPELDRTAQWYGRLLAEAQAVSQRSLDRLRELSRRFGLPHGIIHVSEELQGRGTGLPPRQPSLNRHPALSGQ